MAVLTVAVLASQARADQQPADTGPACPRLRPQGDLASKTLAKGIAASPTLRALAAALEQSDLIIYVAVERRPKGRSDASIQFMRARASSDSSGSRSPPT